ncbi:DEAD box containing protein [Babesia ovata]|uniref:ATP-dependent RNA helicase n=1 Tax=Babesia ovata TaxID=189622 RepID=A0A2H6K6Y3_9APIC|nr:DEAD box containing protein [Babesia ovata]GBE58750.1 DEAD box containing protein [Babesia ovata]
MNVHGLYHLCTFIGYGVTPGPSFYNDRFTTAVRATGFHRQRPPSGFLNVDEQLRDASSAPRPKRRELVHVPDIGADGVVTYAGMFKDADFLPRRALEDVDVGVLAPTGAPPAIGRMLAEVGMERLSRLQLALFDELAYGNNALFHSATSTGKTFSMLLYAALRYYYGVPPDLLCSRKVHELLEHASTAPPSAVGLFQPPESRVLQRVMVLCPTKELAIQSAKQLVAFTGGDKDCVRLIIDDQEHLPEDIGPRSVFIVGSANQLNVYLLTKSKSYVRGIMQHVGMVILDEVDRLLKVTNQYASERKKLMYRKHPTAAFQICQALLALSPNKLQLVGASASISRNHIRFFDTLIQSYRTVRCPLAIIRNHDEQTAANRYVAVPSSVQHFFAVSNTDSLGNKVGKVVSLVRDRPGERAIFFVSSQHSLLSFTHYMERYGLKCKVLHHEFGIRDNVSKRFSGEVVKGMYDHRESSEALEMFEDLRNELDTDGDYHLYAASMDSARGLHFPTLDTVYMVGVPRNVNEYVHISGRVGRCGRVGNCITVDNIANVKKVLAWQKSIDCSISPLDSSDATALSEFRGYAPRARKEDDQ